MNESPRRNRMTRRDFVHGRFWRVLAKAPAANKPNSGMRPLVMRYPQTRRDIEAGDRNGPAGSHAIVAEHAARRRTIPVFRPPGAVDEASFLDGCTRCNKCADACPHDAIVPAPERLREAAGTPLIDPDQQPCLMCEGFPCISACEPNVLTQHVAKMMGTARITEHLCLAHHGTTCSVCAERCPVDNAIETSNGKPTVNDQACTGCGVCRFVCPAPENAILLMPTFARPSFDGSQCNE